MISLLPEISLRTRTTPPFVSPTRRNIFAASGDASEKNNKVAKKPSKDNDDLKISDPIGDALTSKSDVKASAKKGSRPEAELLVQRQLESLRHDATKGIVNVLQKLDLILDRREKIIVPAETTSAHSSSSSSSSSTSSSPSSSTSSSSWASSASSASSVSAKTREKLVSATKLKDELESLVGDALDLVDDKLRGHWLRDSDASLTASSTAPSTSSTVEAEAMKQELKELMEKLEEKSRRRREGT